MNQIKQRELLKTASELLEKAAEEIKALRENRDDLSLENTKLKLSITAVERSRRSELLAKEMYSKGMISKGDLLNKAKEIMNLDDSAFETLKAAVERATAKTEEGSYLPDADVQMQKEAAEYVSVGVSTKDIANVVMRNL